MDTIHNLFCFTFFAPLISQFYSEQSLKQNIDIMAPHRVHITGEGIRSMDLTFAGMDKYSRWTTQVTDIRSKTTIILRQQFQESVVCNLHYNWIPQVEDFVLEWGNDFVPTDISTNLEEARRILDQSPPPNPALVRLLREHLTNELHNALRRQNEEREQDPN